MHQSVDAHPSIPRRPTARGPLSLIIKHSELQANVSADPTITSRAALSSLSPRYFFIIFFHGGARAQRLVITNPLSYFSAPFRGRPGLQAGRWGSAADRRARVGQIQISIFQYTPRFFEGPKPQGSSLHLLSFLFPPRL